MKNKPTSLIRLGFLALAAGGAALLAGCAGTPEIVDGRGEELPESIAVMEQVELNGSRQWVTIRGRDRSNPVLLFLSGGPGGSQLTSTRLHLSELERDFVVVNWDQPGAGKSFRSVRIRDLTPERYVADGLALMEHLRARFDQDQIFILGESWGTILGVWLCQAAPDQIAAYVGAGQMVNTTENDRMGYQFALDRLRAAGNDDRVRDLEKLGPPPYTDGNISLKYAKYLGVLNDYMYARESGEHHDILLDSLKGSEYTFLDKINWIRGLMKVFNRVYPQLADVDLQAQAASLEVPVYLVIGRHDVNAMTSLAEEYFNTLEAPSKELVWFERSGHPALYSEPEKLVSLMTRVKETHMREGVNQ